jgi:hypothetical protein
MAYVYKPGITSKKSNRPKRQKSGVQDNSYVKDILKWNGISLGIIALSIVGFVLIFGNINSLWGFFKPNEHYVEENKDKPAKPFLKADKEFVSEPKVNLEGVAGEGQKVTLYKDNNVESETIADSENKFSFSDVSVKEEQDNSVTFYVVSKNDSGEESEQSNQVTVTYDKEKPKVTISSPNNDDRIKSFSRSLEVKGSTEENTTVTVNGKFARVNNNNEYSATTRLEDEVNVIKVEAEDKAGNKGYAEVAVYYEKID